MAFWIPCKSSQHWGTPILAGGVGHWPHWYAIEACLSTPHYAFSRVLNLLTQVETASSSPSYHPPRVLEDVVDTHVTIVIDESSHHHPILSFDLITQLSRWLGSQLVHLEFFTHFGFFSMRRNFHITNRSAWSVQLSFLYLTLLSYS